MLLYKVQKYLNVLTVKLILNLFILQPSTRVVTIQPSTTSTSGHTRLGEIGTSSHSTSSIPTISTSVAIASVVSTLATAKVRHNLMRGLVV